MTPLLTEPVQGYEVCRPAAGTRAAFNSQDFGTSHWQLMIDGTSFTRLQKGAAMAGPGTKRRFAAMPKFGRYRSHSGHWACVADVSIRRD